MLDDLVHSLPVCGAPDNIASSNCGPAIAKLNLERFDPRVFVHYLLAQLKVLWKEL